MDKIKYIIVLVLGFVLWFFCPFKWRSELEFGIVLPATTKNLWGVYGVERTFQILDLGYSYETGSNLFFTIKSEELDVLLNAIEVKCSHPYKSNFNKSNLLLETGKLSYHRMFLDRKFGDFLFVNIMANNKSYDVQFSSTWN